MKLRRLKPTSTVAEQLKYLRKRHALYFSCGKINEKQIIEMLQLLIKRVQQIKEIVGDSGNICGEDLNGIANFDNV